MAESPLAGLRVVELGHALAGPLAATLLADFGAEVVKVERIGGGDSLRAMGPKHDDVGVWWSVTGRNKRSICLDYKEPVGRDILLRLLADADVLVENFRTGVLDRAGLGWDVLSARFPRLIMLRISGFGQTGPYRERPGFGKIAEAFSGATYLTGDPDVAPVHPGYSLADATTGLMGAFGVMMALHSRTATGVGQMVDLALYEPLLRMIEWQLPMFELLDQTPVRNGTRFPFEGAFVTDIAQTADGESIVVSAATIDSLERLRAFVAALMTEAGVEWTPESDAEVVERLRQWVGEQTREEALEELQARGLVAGPIYSAGDIASDPHIAARENIARVDVGTGESIPMPSVVPKLSGTPGDIRRPAPHPGEHTDVLLAEMGLDQGEIRALHDAGIVAAGARMEAL